MGAKEKNMFTIDPLIIDKKKLGKNTRKNKSQSHHCAYALPVPIL
jgi:hypothetical protein